MTREDIIKLAREVGATPYTNRHYPDRPTHTFNPEQLERFAALVAAHEREACAQVCEGLISNSSRQSHTAAVWDIATFDCAAAIRARGQA